MNYYNEIELHHMLYIVYEGKSDFNQFSMIEAKITSCVELWVFFLNYPEVEQSAVVLIKCLLERHNLLEDVSLECQGSERRQKPAVSWE